VTQYTIGSPLNLILLISPLPAARDFFRILFDPLALTYAKVGCCVVEKPRWFSLVLRAVGLRGDGETGVQETFRAAGELRARVGREATLVAAEMLRESLGLATRAANMAAQRLYRLNEKSLESVWCSNKRIRDRFNER